MFHMLVILELTCKLQQMQTYGKAKMVIVDSMPTPAMADIMAVLEVPVGQTMEQDSHWYTNSETIMQKKLFFYI